MGEARKLLSSEKTRLPDITVPHPKHSFLTPRSPLIIGHGAQLQRARLAKKMADSGTRV